MSNYLKRLPDFEYVSRLPNSRISDYIRVKNFFKKSFVREDIFQDVTDFTKYDIEGDDRPDNVAFKYYGRSDLDWLVLTANNIINIQNEWPLNGVDFDNFLLEKYETYEKINDIHHYETTEVTNIQGVVIVPAGIEVDKDYTIIYSDPDRVTSPNIRITPVTSITNYQYEEKIQDSKRSIYLLNKTLVQLAIDDLSEMMLYEKGSTQYVSETLKRADNVRLYD